MERGPSVEDLIHSIQQDVFSHMDSHSPMFGNASHNQFDQNESWNVMTYNARNRNMINQSGNEVVQHQNGKFQHGRPQTPYKPVSNDIMIVPTPVTASTLLQSSPPPQPTPNYTSTLHEELTFSQPQSTDFQGRGTLYSHEKRSAEVVQLQPHSPRDHGQFMPQPPLEPRRSRTRSSIRRAAKLLLNRSKQVLSSSDSNIASSSPSSRTKASKKDGGPSVKDRLNRNRARMGELLKSPSWKERRQSSSEEKENSYMVHPKDIVNNSTQRDHVRLSHVNSNRRFHSAENISSSILSSDSSHYSGSEMNDISSNYMDDVSFDGSIVSGGYALRRYNSGPIEQQNRQRRWDHHRGYHTADSDTDSSIGKGENRNMAVQNRFGSGRHVRSTRDALKKLNRNRSFNGHSSRPAVIPKHTPSGPLKGDHTIQPFIHNERLHDSYVLERWKEQGARPKYSSSESLETESVNHEIFPDTAIRSDSEDHRGSRSSLASKHSRPPSPSRSVRFEDQELDTGSNLCNPTNMVEPERTSKKHSDIVEVRYRSKHPDSGGCLKHDGRKITDDVDDDEEDVFINGHNDLSLLDPILRHWGNQREHPGSPSRTHVGLHGNQGNHGSDTKSTSFDGNGHSKNDRQDMSGMDVTLFGRGSSIGDEVPIWDENKGYGDRDPRTHKTKSLKSSSKDDELYSADVLQRGEQMSGGTENMVQQDNLDQQLEDAIEPVYEEVKRAKKRYSTQANHYYDAIQAHSAWDEYKRKLMEENQRQRASSFAGMSSFAKNRDHVQKLSGSNLSIASNSSLSEKMQNLGHATKQSFGRMRRALSLDKINRNSQKDDPLDKESRLKRSPSLRSLSSFLGKKKDKLMGSFTDLSPKERRSASISGPSSVVMEQVTNPSYMRKIGRVLEVFDDGTQLVRLVKPPSGPFGFYIAKGSSANGPGIFVKRIGDGHPAKILAGLLQVGDEILEINGNRVKEEKNLDMVYDLILDNDNLVLKIRPLERRGEELS